jgi:hypothetical protein
MVAIPRRGKVPVREKTLLEKTSVEKEKTLVDKAPAQVETNNTGTIQTAVRNTIVILSMWISGAALMGVCVLALYHLFRLLVWGLAGT